MLSGKLANTPTGPFPRGSFVALLSVLCALAFVFASRAPSRIPEPTPSSDVTTVDTGAQASSGSDASGAASDVTDAARTAGATPDVAGNTTSADPGASATPAADTPAGVAEAPGSALVVLPATSGVAPADGAASVTSEAARTRRCRAGLRAGVKPVG